MIPSLTVLDSQRSRKELERITFRSPREGPEAELVRRFLREARIHISGDCRLTVFLEPKLECSYPDIVLVAWKPSVTRAWHPARKRLERQDLKVLQYLVNSGASSLDALAPLFGRTVTANLSRLRKAELVSEDRNAWRSKRLSSIFAVVAIVAIEAKMKDLNAAMQQAFLNTWFASRTYVLFPDKKFERHARRSPSIGVLSANSSLSLLRAGMRPLSYASWQFNEWAWRASLRTR